MLPFWSIADIIATVHPVALAVGVIAAIVCGIGLPCGYAYGMWDMRSYDGAISFGFWALSATVGTVLCIPLGAAFGAIVGFFGSFLLAGVGVYVVAFVAAAAGIYQLCQQHAYR